MIHLENVTFRYRDDAPPALTNINLAIRAGESVCVMGANGSGKSTFARLLAGLVDLRQGQVRIASPGGRAVPVALIFQNPDNQMVAVTVEKELAFGLENLGYDQSDMERLVGQSLEKFGIGHLRNRLTMELSGGEKQRVALASVMIFEPDILVLDEPDSFLDEEGKAALKRELANIRSRKPSMVQIHITQYPDVARSYDRLLVFDRGEIAADGRPRDVFADRPLCVRTGLVFDAGGKAALAMPFAPSYSDRNDATHIYGIESKQVGFQYAGDGFVLRNLSCELRAGQTVGIVGLSGSGKSTLGSILCGLLKPTAGEVSYVSRHGQVIDSERAFGLVSGVFQQPERQFFLPTCREEVAFGPGNFGRKLSEEQIHELLAMVGLDAKEFAGRDPFTLSGGEKRRLAFAAVLAMSPDFVIFDEPTCGLDPEGVGRFIVLARTLRRLGAGLAVISHDGELIRALADSIVMLRTDVSNLVMTADEFFANPDYCKIVSPAGDSFQQYS
ncbi:MAG: ATP-binding cassette domain-containing protein [Candidatus Zixiibacteriota bacterium]|nr:MAG: ATP-binding cassette domain-containing protein [candidate division Zixibacteria bacterium]